MNSVKRKLLHFAFFALAVGFVLIAHFYFSDYGKSIANNIVFSSF